MPTVTFEKNKKEALANLISVNTGTHITPSINKSNLWTETNLSITYISLYTAFVHDVGESFPSLKYKCFRIMFEELREALELYAETKEYDSRTLKRIMVHLNLELGTDVRFIDEFQQMLSENLLEKDYSDLQEDFTFEKLYNHYTPKDTTKERKGNLATLAQLYGIISSPAEQGLIHSSDKNVAENDSLEGKSKGNLRKKK